MPLHCPPKRPNQVSGEVFICLGFQCFQSNYPGVEQSMCFLLCFPVSCILNDVKHKLYLSAYHPFKKTKLWKVSVTAW